MKLFFGGCYILPVGLVAHIALLNFVMAALMGGCGALLGVEVY